MQVKFSPFLLNISLVNTIKVKKYLIKEKRIVIIFKGYYLGGDFPNTLLHKVKSPMIKNRRPNFFSFNTIKGIKTVIL